MKSKATKAIAGANLEAAFQVVPTVSSGFAQT
jgi:hypothetical protein